MRVRAECPHCDNRTNFWIQENRKGMCPCTARRTWTLRELGVSNPTFHGSTKGSAEWVIDNYKNNSYYEDNNSVRLWIMEAEEILNGK